MKDLRFDSKLVHAGYDASEGGGCCVPPLYLTNAYEFRDVEHARTLFSLEESGNIYSRIMNPTNDVLEKRVAELEGGVGALALSSGHAAIFLTMAALAGAGDEIVSSSCIYGGAINLLGVSLKKFGVTVRFVHPDDLQGLRAAINDRTRAVFVESVGNPNANVADLSAMAAVAHENGLPLIVDATFATPYLQRPFEFGADIVVHSATKFLCGNGTVMAGIVVDGGCFQWAGNPRFPEFNNPDPSYHGVVYARDMGKAAFIGKLRVQMLRDYGACLSPFNAFMVLHGIETLALRMRRHCDSGLAAARFLSSHPAVAAVNYPGLEDSPYYELSQKYLPRGCGSVFTFDVKGGREAGERFINALRLFKLVANVGDVRSLVIHPASTTHSQLSEEQLRAADIGPGTIRLSVGIEDVEDLIDDLAQALARV